MIPLRQSTASQIIQLGGVFVDSGDGDTEETALTIANTDIKLHKNGATSLASKNSGGGTHMANGRYYATFDATDTNTVGPLTITVHVSGALVETIHCFVFEEAIYDAFYASGATGALPSTLVQGGINTTSGTITTLDALDTAQDTQHGTTQTYLSTNLGSLGANATEAGGTGDHLTALALSAAGVSTVQSGLATPTNITAGTITTVTNLTNAPTNGDLTATMKSSVTTAATSSTPTVTLASSEDIYHANIEYTFDDPEDEYTVTWFKNGQRVSSGITSPTIQVVKRADGTDLIASSAMTQIGTTGSYKYDEASNVIEVDEAYLAIVGATIDSLGRSFSCLIKRSS